MSSEDGFRRSSPRPSLGLTLTQLKEGDRGDVDGVDEGPTTPLRRPSSLTEGASMTKEKLKSIHEELDTLRRRREELEQRRRHLLAASIPPRAQNSRRGSAASSVHEAGGRGATRTRSQEAPSHVSLLHSNYMHATSSSRRREETSASAARNGSTHRRTGRGPHSSACSSVRAHSTGVGGHTRCRGGSSVYDKYSSYIPSEQQRRRELPDTPFLAMKNAMREAARFDSTLVMGDFLLEDNSRVYTFGRERRFMPVVGQRGSYYLATDTALAQEEARMSTARGGSVSGRILYTDEPGPGAYTPRYNKVSKPSPLVQMRW